MKPMSLYESGDSNGKISLQELMNGNKNIDGIKTDLTMKKLLMYYVAVVGLIQ